MNNDKLTAEVTQELDQLRRVAEHAAELAKVPPEDRRPWHAAAAAKYAADLVSGLENLCKRRYRSATCPSPKARIPTPAFSKTSSLPPDWAPD